MTKQLFTNIVTRMATIQKKCRDMIKVLESVGIQVGEDPDGQGLSQLHGIRDLVSETVAALLLSTKDEDVTMEKIDMFLEDLGGSEDSLKLINKKYVELFGNKRILIPRQNLLWRKICNGNTPRLMSVIAAIVV